jgi:outer membrane receptor protein involved in Fe transport
MINLSRSAAIRPGTARFGDLLLGSASALVIAAAAPAQAADTPAAADTATSDTTTVETIVVTGSTTKRTLLNASVAITAVSASDLAQKAPRGTDDILELIPGIFVEGTAGPVSNNYSVRGLPGGGQNFVRIIEDGLPTIYGGLNDDEVFQNDITIDHVEAVEGGTSGILTENAAGASINFISRPLNFDEAGGLARVSGASYGDKRADFWYSAPIMALGKGVAFSAGGYIDSSPGIRSSPFNYDTYHFKIQLEKKWDDGGYVKLTYKRWDEHDAYYADQPYQVVNGQITGVPGLSTQSGNITGPGFAAITLPDSCAANECTRTFSASNGIHATGNEYRIDLERPINSAFTVFGKFRYTQTDWDFNGIFPGSGVGNSGLTSAVNYLTNSSVSPIQSLLQEGALAFPTATQFGIKNLTNGQVIASSNVAALNALNGNGLLQQTWLNRQLVKIRDYGSDFGVRWQLSGGHWSNNLTVGGMYYSQHISGDQSAVSNIINDVANGSNIYDIVALNAAGGVVGTLSNNGIIGYGDWGQGISSSTTTSGSFYFNDELTVWNRLHLDFGLRYESESTTQLTGNATPAPVPAGTAGLLQVNNNAFNGTFNQTSGGDSPTSYTVGLNYTILSNLSVYGRYAVGYQTQGENQATSITLYEGGVTYSGYGLLGTVRLFRTEFDNQNYSGIDLADPSISTNFEANSDTNGVDIDVVYRPTFEALHAFSVHGQATFQKSSFSNVFIGETINGQIVNNSAATFYDGKVPQRTPETLFTITPTYDLPYHLGTVYLRYKYIGKIFADSGDGLALPSYGVLSLGGNITITPRLTLNVSVDNVTNAIGLTEGNPRQGNTQAIVNGYFYGRGIIGTNVLSSLTFKF